MNTNASTNTNIIMITIQLQFFLKQNKIMGEKWMSQISVKSMDSQAVQKKLGETIKISIGTTK